MKKQHIPTYDEYKELVKEWLRPMLKHASPEDLDRYLKTEDAEGEMRLRYTKDKNKYVAGEISYEAFTESGVGTVGYNLYMLY